MRCHLDSFELWGDPGSAGLRWFALSSDTSETLFSMPLSRRRSKSLSLASNGSRETSAGRLGTIVGSLWNSWDLKKTGFRFRRVAKSRLSLEDALWEIQSTPDMVSETPSELPKTLPRAPREVPGASPRPLGSGPRRLQRYFSSAPDLRSTSETVFPMIWGPFLV